MKRRRSKLLLGEIVQIGCGGIRSIFKVVHRTPNRVWLARVFGRRKL